jgi:translation initiation factor IF-3
MGKSKKPYYQLNERISADTLRLVGEDAGQIGVMSKAEALELAKKEGLDVVMVSSEANPPVAKLIDFAKFKYQQKQKHKGSKKATKSVDIKEIRFTPFIAQGDYAVRIKKARDFLEDGNKVKLNVKFTGRQITRKQFGEDLMDRAIEDLKDMATVEREPAFVGKVLTAQLQPK